MNQPLSRRVGLALAACLMVFLMRDSAEAQVRDRGLRWHQIETEHFVVAYHEPLGVLARRAAAICERAHARLSQVLAHDLTAPVYVVLTDGTDSANGAATSLPYNTIRLFATAPDDLSALGEVDDWFHLLITHEHTHVLHLDTTSGVPALVNRILGKVLAPNLVQPRWFIEGLATHMETRESSAGRLRSSMFSMFMRMDALDDRFLGLDQLSNTVDRWPRGNSYYLYGSHFVEFIANRYGRDALTALSHEYGRRLIPYGINRAARRVTGSTFVELYEEFLADQRLVANQARAQVVAAGLVEGERLTVRGDVARSPRWSGNEHILYYLNAGGLDAQVRRISRDGESPQRPGQELVRAVGNAYIAPLGGNELVYSALDTHRDIYTFYDLFRLAEDGSTERLTSGMRAREPDVHEGRVVFTKNGAGTTHLMIADLSDVAGTARVLLRNPRYAQVYTPRFSPDGRTVAISRWTEGGYRDIQLVDVETGRVTRVTRDRALDSGPAWSPDGRLLYFASDRSGISNIYRFEIETQEILQVTNVVAGAFSPDVSPDGRSLVYLGYTSFGFDVWRLNLSEAEPRAAEPYAVERLPAPPAESVIRLAERYQARHTLWPRSYLLDLQSTSRGNQLGLSITQTDIAGHYRYDARLGVVLETGDVDVEAGFTFGRLRAPIRLGAFRRIADRGGLEVGGVARTWVEESLGADVQVSYSMPRALHDSSFYSSYSLTYLRQHEPWGGRIDPNTPPPVFPTLGRLATFRAGYSYSDVRSRLYDMTPTAGRTISLDVRLSHPGIGSQFRSTSLQWSWRRYIEMPWSAHHSLALRYGGGLGGGDLNRRGLFSVGGFPGSSFVDGLISGATFGGVALRGYPANGRIGTQMHLVQVEYHLPLFRVMRGVGTLPAYLSRVHAALFVDAGDAFFGRINASSVRVGAGAELFADLQLGYVLSFRVRLGIAYGFMEEGGLQGYLHLGTPF